ncbi:MAG: hypothetical protein MJ102_08200 [Clostridia bacterium]|nr:hypothetical protein [Clostridia bacterium]
MSKKRISGLKIYIILMLAANLILAFIVGRAFFSEKKPNASASHTNGNDVTENSFVADQRTDRPSISDFQKWYYTPDRGIPADADLNVTREDTYGEWKATVYVTGKTAKDDKILLLNIEIIGEGDNVTLTMDWYSSTDIGKSETTDETSKKDTVLDGVWKNGAIVISDGKNEFEIPDFYKLNGKEYGMGSGTMDGLRIDIGLVRNEQ